MLVLGGTAPAWATEGRDISERSLRRFRERGCRIVLTDTARGLEGSPELVRQADESYALDFTDPAACAAWATAYAVHHRVDAVVGFREYAVVSVAETAAALGLRGNDPAAVRRVRAKDACREFLRARGFRQPRLRLCATEGEAAGFLAAEEGAPVVLKPRDRCNSEGVRLVRAPAELPDAFAEAQGEDGLVLAESFVEGAEYSVEGIFTGGVPRVLAVTAKQLADGSFTESGHTMPAPLPAAAEREAAETTTRALTELGLSAGPFHVECWLTPGGVVLGEVHVRQGGDGIHALLEWCLPGLDLYGTWLEDLLGRTPELPASDLGPPGGTGPEGRRGAAVRFLMPPAGTVTRVEGWEKAAEHPAVLMSGLSLAEGTEVAPGRSNAERYGMVLVGGDTAESAGALADELIGAIEVRLA